MAALLREHEFQVEEYYDVNKRGFEDMMRRILFEVGSDVDVLFYFAGHGIQIGRRNYLLPVDAKLSSAYDTPFETLALDAVLKVLGERSRSQVVILDSCRNNPFTDAKLMTGIEPMLFETREGFSATSAPVNSMVAFSTSPGMMALDGDTGNSPFTSSFVRLANADPVSDVRTLLERVRRDVYTQTGGAQVPWESSTLVEPFFLGVPPATGTERAQYGMSRGLSPILAQLGGPTGGVQPVASTSNTISSVLNRRIVLGEALVDALSLRGSDPITIDPKLEFGRLVEEGSRDADYRGQPLSAADLKTLVYEYIPRQRAARGDIDDFTLTEKIVVRRPGGGEQSVNLVMQPDACDFLAGDWLDPEGVGLARYPNEIDAEAAIPACRAAVARSPEVGRFHYQLGRALQADLQYEEARRAFERSRDLGHTRAWHALGDLVAEAEATTGGQSNVAAPEEALAFYAEGVERGDPYAFHALGKQLLRYGKSEASRSYGFELLSQAIELGHTFSMNELGYFFTQEGTDHFDPKRGIRYLTELAGRNDIYGYNNLGLLFEKGVGPISPNPSAALDWYRKAADGGHPYAPVNIGRMYFNGELGTPDPVQAIQWYDQGLDRGTAWGGANAAWIILNQHPKGYTIVDAAVRAAKAAGLLDHEAANQAMQMLDALEPRVLDMATQMLIGNFEPEQTVDGVVGPATREALGRLAHSYGVDMPADNAMARLLALSKIYWRAHGIRIDLL